MIPGWGTKIPHAGWSGLVRNFKTRKRVSKKEKKKGYGGEMYERLSKKTLLRAGKRGSCRC